MAAGLALAALVGACSPKHDAGSGSAVGGAFSLTDQNGARVTEAVLKGRWSAVFFGYVSCPDICPATMQTLAEAKARLPKGSPDLQVVFITVDPARDTPAQLKAWLEQPGFPAKVVALTGTPAAIDAAAKAYRVYYSKEGSGPAYQMAHSAAIYLMDPEGRLAAPLTYTQGPAKLAADIGAAMHGAT
jgi:protein SCO1/2